MSKAVDHDIAYKVDPLRTYSFSNEIFARGAFCSEEKIGDRIGDDAVDLFRHTAVAAAQPRLDVGYGQYFFGSYKCARHGGINVSRNHNHRWAISADQLAESLHHLRSLCMVCPGTDLQVVIRLAQIELF